MLQLTADEILLFQKLIAYIDALFLPKEGAFAGKLSLLGNPTPPSWDYDAFFDLFAALNNQRTIEPPFCEKFLACLDGDMVRLATCCKKACLSKNAHKKICQKTYSPTKATACKLLLAARLDHHDAACLLKNAGYPLHRYNKFDIVIHFFLLNRVDDIAVVNKFLYLLDLPLLGYSFV